MIEEQIRAKRARFISPWKHFLDGTLLSLKVTGPRKDETPRSLTVYSINLICSILFFFFSSSVLEILLKSVSEINF